MRSNAEIARSMAIKFWGHPDHQKKIADGIWLFSTASHGGMIVDTNVRTELRSYNSAVTSRQYLIPSEQHFAAFEEDCMAAIVEWVYASDIYTHKFRSMYVSDLSDEDFFQERLKLIHKSLERWNPDVLEKWPNPNY